ncbi:hypothetical protein Fot_41523 [Forsythia ovata]|uniref:Uncharacterized protein n=1 Tax=Forsythia ovata TaxID=205694 RepID=A0ABD1RJE0_9LAMI
MRDLNDCNAQFSMLFEKAHLVGHCPSLLQAVQENVGVGWKNRETLISMKRRKMYTFRGWRVFNHSKYFELPGSFSPTTVIGNNNVSTVVVFDSSTTEKLVKLLILHSHTKQVVLQLGLSPMIPCFEVEQLGKIFPSRFGKIFLVSKSLSNHHFTTMKKNLVSRVVPFGIFPQE